MNSISRHYREDHVKAGTFETRVAIYEDQIRGWFLDQARVLQKASDHAGFVILLVVLSYVEAHAIFYKGQDSKNSSREFFRDAFKAIFSLSSDNPGLIDVAVDELYHQMRNGLFHTGVTRRKVHLSDQFQKPVNIDLGPAETVSRIEVNPTKMLETVEDHLSHYLMRLRNVEEKELRENFDKAWDLRNA
jgi:hypothetical protein